MRLTSLGMLIAVCSNPVAAETAATSSAPASFRGRIEVVHGDAPSDSGGLVKRAYRVVDADVESLRGNGQDVGSPPVTGPQPWVTILLRFSNSTNVTPHPRSWFHDLMGSSYPGMDHYWREVSYDAINLDGSQIAGWYDLPHPRSYYVYVKDGEEILDFERAAEDAVAVADDDVFFPDFLGINLMFNEVLNCVGMNCFAWGSSGWTVVADGTSQVYYQTWLPPWAYNNQNAMAHEMGHGFGMPHSLCATSANFWEKIGVCSMRDPDFGCIAVHEISFHKNFFAGWIPLDRIYVPPPSMRAGSSSTPG